MVVRAVFIFEGSDVSVHTSLAAAAGHVEAIDVNDGVFDFFTDDGTVLAAVTLGQQVTLLETDERRPQELRDRLRQYLSHPRLLLDPTLAQDPVAAAQAILHEEWERRSFRWLSWLDRRANGAAPPVV